MADGPALIETAPAKVNLFLHIVGRRADGYHLLDSLAVFPPVGDALSVTADSTFCLVLTGPFAPGLAGEGDNLVARAARVLAEHAGIAPSGRIVLDKRLPVASGIGGGSADAAAALRLLARLWQINLAPADLLALAAPLGADVPVCVASRPARMSGIGEQLDPAPRLPSCGMVLVNPRVAVSTRDVFRARIGAFSEPACLPPAWPDAATMACDLTALRNDLEAPAIACAPVIADVLATLRALPGCLFARMSGSGATCFALFATPAEAAGAADRVRPEAWWRWGGALG